MFTHLFLFVCNKFYHIQNTLYSYSAGHFIHIFYWTTKQWVTLQQYTKKMYKKHETFRIIVDRTFHLYDTIDKMSTTHLIEPETSGYFCICTSSLSIVSPEETDTNTYISDSHENTYTYHEKYSYFETTQIRTDEDVHNAINVYHKHLDDNHDMIENRYQSLCMMKYSNKYVIQVYPCILPETEMTFIQSSVRLMVEYTHPKQSQQITLTIPKTMYIEGNHILSSMFVLRLLKYQSEKFHFDMDYKLKIIDDEINMFELSSHQFIVLTDNTYRIIG